MTHTVQLQARVPAGASRVVVDGHDISDAVTSATLELDARSPTPELHLKLGYCELDTVEAAEARVVITEPTRQALLALGWTPPEEGT